MKTIGLIGGITWHSTLDYYRMINEMINDNLGGVASAKLILHSVNFAEIKTLTEDNRWDLLAECITDIGLGLEEAGADCILICANTMHKVADQVQQALAIPLINIATETAKAIRKQDQRKVALLGTKYVMQMEFYRNKLAAHGIEAIIPGEEDIEYINSAIYNEMGKGIFLRETGARLLEITDGLVARGAQGVILGCTEIPILLKDTPASVPMFDTARIHAMAAVEFALSHKLN
ncbi:aspartate/glutamate racemase family protein [Segetibacter sp. 3557_3]|nr:aspartate/glutamate racemase family protein [Segetibacter sp. 3557_3]